MGFPWNTRTWQIWDEDCDLSLRGHLKSVGFLELLHLVKVTQTHTQAGLQPSSQGFLRSDLHFPFPARTFYLQRLSLYLYFLTLIFIAIGIISTSFNFDPELTYFSSPFLHPPLSGSLLPQFFHSISSQMPLLPHSFMLGPLPSSGMLVLLLESVSFHHTFWGNVNHCIYHT